MHGRAALRTALTFCDAFGNEFLAAKSGVHGHDQHEVDIAGNFLERDDRGRWIEHHASFDTEALDECDAAMKVGKHFDVHRQHVGARRPRTLPRTDPDR